MFNQRQYPDCDPGPFICTSSNPENGDWGEYAEYVGTMENLSLSVAKDAYERVKETLDPAAIDMLEKDPRHNTSKSWDIIHAKFLYRRIMELQSGIRYEKDGSIHFRV